MIDPIFHSDNYQLARNLLDASVLRQEAIAANIANAETPGYRRVDVAGDFAAQLRTRLEAGTLAERAPGDGPRLVEDPNARTVRPDGNSVDVETELLAMNRNAVEHEFLTEMVSSSLKQLRLAITGRPSF
jgi:flagellar basal-body rod protein FlgB